MEGRSSVHRVLSAQGFQTVSVGPGRLRQNWRNSRNRILREEYRTQGSGIRHRTPRADKGLAHAGSKQRREGRTRNTRRLRARAFWNNGVPRRTSGAKVSRSERDVLLGHLGAGSMKGLLDTDPYVLPRGLPVPIDDDACRHLLGMKMPSFSLRSTGVHAVNLADASKRNSVFFFYPETGKPGALIPDGWNDIPGARGCTPQSCAFRDHYQEFKKLGFEVFGVSTQNLDEQIEFAERNNLPYELLNDSDFRLTKALQLPTFKFGFKTFVKRLALVVGRGRIEKCSIPSFHQTRTRSSSWSIFEANTSHHNSTK